MAADNDDDDDDEDNKKHPLLTTTAAAGIGHPPPHRQQHERSPPLPMRRTHHRSDTRVSDVHRCAYTRLERRAMLIFLYSAAVPLLGRLSRSSRPAAGKRKRLRRPVAGRRFVRPTVARFFTFTPWSVEKVMASLVIVNIARRGAVVLKNGLSPCYSVVTGHCADGRRRRSRCEIITLCVGHQRCCCCCCYYIRLYTQSATLSTSRYVRRNYVLTTFLTRVDVIKKVTSMSTFQN